MYVCPWHQNKHVIPDGALTNHTGASSCVMSSPRLPLERVELPEEDKKPEAETTPVFFELLKDSNITHPAKTEPL